MDALRYTCESECYSCFQLNHPLCYIPQSKSMFIVSRARIRRALSFGPRLLKHAIPDCLAEFILFALRP
jgi:hypothetical protein